MAAAVIATTATPSLGDETLWAPDQFDGVWVHIDDRAKNGCWTNIGEVEAYAQDQLRLKGFNVVDTPKLDSEEVSPFFEKNYGAFVIIVEASRWKSGLCVGSSLFYLLGPVRTREDPNVMIATPIGYPLAQSVWDPKNLNHITLDSVKFFIPQWIKEGQLTVEH